MCLIAYAQKDKSDITTTNLTRGFAHNNDAWGVMFPDGERVQMFKDTSKLEDFFAAWRGVPDKTPVASHFRFATHGSKGVENAHPFDVLGDGRIGMMHNGVIRSMGTEADLSDTAIFVRDWIKPQLEHSPELIEIDAWRGMVGDFIGQGSKLLFMLWDGRTFLINDKQGHWEAPGVWYSNKYSIEPEVVRGVGVPSRFWHAPHYGNNPTGEYAGYGYYGRGDDGAVTPSGTETVTSVTPGTPGAEQGETCRVEVAGDGTAKLVRKLSPDDLKPGQILRTYANGLQAIIEVDSDGKSKIVSMNDEKERLAAKASDNRRKADAALKDAANQGVKERLKARGWLYVNGIWEHKSQMTPAQLKGLQDAEDVIEAETDKAIDPKTCDPMVAAIEKGFEDDGSAEDGDDFEDVPPLTPVEARQLSDTELFQWVVDAAPEDVADLILDLL